MTDPVPFTPTNGRVLIRQLPYRPSKIIDVFTVDKADENEGIVAALSPCRYGRKRIKGGWEHTGVTFPHEVKIGDRVMFPGAYGDQDTMTFNGVKHRAIESWDIMGILDAPQIEHYEHPVTGDVIPDKHPIHIFGAA